jgi:hypothetical protein
MPNEIVIREAHPQDVAEIVSHRRRMYEDMGERDAAVLDAMQASTAAFLEKAIPRGVFRGWLAQTRAKRVVAGGGMMIVPWLSRPADPEPRRPLYESLGFKPTREMKLALRSSQHSARRAKS